MEPTLLIFELFRKLFPFEASETDRMRFPELQQRYKSFTILEIIPFFAFAGLSWYLWYKGLLALEALSQKRLGPAIFLAVPSIYYWMLLSLFLGIIFSAPLLQIFYKSIFRDRYADYVLYNNMRVGFDTWKLLRSLAVLIVVPALAFVLLGMDAYVKVTDREIIVNQFGSLNEQRYNFSMVTGVKSASHFIAPNGKAVERAHFIINFIDGTTWTTRDWLRDPEPGPDRQLADFIALKAGKRVQTVRFDE